MEFWKSLCFLVIAIPILIEAANWDYTDGPGGPANWKNSDARCGGTRQSPIDYKSGEITYGETSLTPLVLSGYTSTSGNVSLKNTGGTLKVEKYERGANNLTGRGLPGTFTFAQLHFHWGPDNNSGSEHTVGGKSYPLELHFVHYNLKYPNLTSAVFEKDGLAVLGVFFEISGSDNEKLNPMLDHVTKIVNADTTTKITEFNMMDLMPSDKEMFYRNNGSLTTPPCAESVTWTVFKKTLGVSVSQLTKFRSLKYTNGQAMVKNYRPIQATNGRKIYATFAEAVTTTTSSTAATTTGTSGAESQAAVSFAVVLMSLFSLVLFN